MEGSAAARSRPFGYACTYQPGGVLILDGQFAQREDRHSFAPLGLRLVPVQSDVVSLLIVIASSVRLAHLAAAVISLPF